jgi:murein DD-endopeptidase MepM/ murein hydrolase activator NlpD
MNKIRIKSIIFLIVLIITILSFSQPLFAYSYSEVFGNYPPSILNWNCPTNVWYSITSKWNQPRSVGTNPHQGVDIAAPYGSRVNAVWYGWVESIGTYSIRLRVDSNGNGLMDEPVYYCYYYHLSAKKPNGYYSKGAQVGSSGNEGGTMAAHLHFGGIDTNIKWCRNETNYRWTSNWNAGRDVDSFSREQWNGSSCNITAYFKDEAGTYIPYEVRLYHRKNGTSTWTDGGNMTAIGYNIYSYNFSGKYPSGTTINWLVRIKRGGLGSTYCWCFAPAKYNQPDPNPNASAYRYAYFTNTIK